MGSQVAAAIDYCGERPQRAVRREIPGLLTVLGSPGGLHKGLGATGAGLGASVLCERRCFPALTPHPGLQSTDTNFSYHLEGWPAVSPPSRGLIHSPSNVVTSFQLTNATAQIAALSNAGEARLEQHQLRGRWTLTKEHWPVRAPIGCRADRFRQPWPN